MSAVAGGRMLFEEAKCCDGFPRVPAHTNNIIGLLKPDVAHPGLYTIYSICVSLAELCRALVVGRGPFSATSTVRRAHRDGLNIYIGADQLKPFTYPEKNRSRFALFTRYDSV